MLIPTEKSFSSDCLFSSNKAPLGSYFASIIIIIMNLLLKRVRTAEIRSPTDTNRRIRRNECVVQRANKLNICTHAKRVQHVARSQNHKRIECGHYSHHIGISFFLLEYCLSGQRSDAWPAADHCCGFAYEVKGKHVCSLCEITSIEYLPDR